MMDAYGDRESLEGLQAAVAHYESQRKRGPIVLSSNFPLAEVWQTDLLERNQQAIAFQGQEITLSVRPYEIVTLRLVPQQGS